MWRILASLLILSLTRVVYTDNENNLFIYPTAPGPQQIYVGNELWTVGDVKTIQWVTSYTDYSIDLYQQILDTQTAINAGTVYSTTYATGNQSFNWVVQLYDTNLTTSPVYWLWFYTGGQYVFSAHYFNITTKGSTSTSSATSSSSSKSPTSTASLVTLSSTTSSSSTVTSTSTANPNPSSDDASKVGLGVGLGLGIPLVIAATTAIVLFWIRHRRTSQAVESRHSDQPLNDLSDQHYNDGMDKTDVHDAPPYSDVSTAFEVDGAGREPVEAASKQVGERHELQ